MNTRLEAMNARMFWERLFTNALDSLSDVEVIKCAEEFSNAQDQGACVFKEIFPKYVKLAIAEATDRLQKTPQVRNVVPISVVRKT